MNTRNILFCIMFFLFLNPHGLGIRQQQSELKGKRISVKGRIIGYSRRAWLRSVQGQVVSPPRDAFLFLVEQGNEGLESGKYIKIQYRVTPQHHEELPPTLFEESSQRSFVLEKDETCDESTESFVYGDKFGSRESSVAAAKRFPNLALLRGAENIRLPEERVLRCYSFDWDGIAR